jgi:hypothetical protein
MRSLNAGYIPYSGTTPTSGITGRIVYLAPDTRPDASLAGKLVLVEMPKLAWTGQFFHQRAVHAHDPNHAMGPDTPYARPFQMLGPFILLLDSLQAAGAAGVIVILDTPSLAADGLYAPYDGVVRQLPGVFIDHGHGQRPAQPRAGGHGARLAADLGCHRAAGADAQFDRHHSRQIRGIDGTQQQYGWHERAGNQWAERHRRHGPVPGAPAIADLRKETAP